MDWEIPQLQDLFGRVIGDALNRTQCVWEKADGTQCQKSVTKESRKNGAICLKMVQDFPAHYPPERMIAQAAKYMLCTECQRNRDRSWKCAERWIDLLTHQSNRLESDMQSKKSSDSGTWFAQRWPTSMSNGSNTSN